MSRRPDPNSIAGQIRALHAEGYAPEDISDKVDATLKYVNWVIWNVVNGDLRRRWERKHKQERYALDEEFRERQKKAASRYKARVKSKEARPAP